VPGPGRTLFRGLHVPGPGLVLCLEACTVLGLVFGTPFRGLHGPGPGSTDNVRV
jgi:hypothetical protein